MFYFLVALLLVGIVVHKIVCNILNLNINETETETELALQQK